MACKGCVAPVGLPVFMLGPRPKGHPYGLWYLACGANMDPATLEMRGIRPREALLLFYQNRVA